MVLGSGVTRHPVVRALSILSILACSGANSMPAEQDREVVSASNESADIHVGAEPYWLDTSKNCGVMCLFFLDQLLGEKRAFGDIAEMCPARDYGLQLREMSDIAEVLGFHTLGFKGTVRDLKRAQHPVILRYEIFNDLHKARRRSNDHFVVVLGWDQDASVFRVYDPPYVIHSVTDSEMSRLSAGIGLLISKTPTTLKTGFSPAPKWPAAVGSGLIGGVCLAWLFRRRHKGNRFASMGLVWLVLLLATQCLPGCGRRPAANSWRSHDMGRVKEGDSIEHIFQVHNESDRPLTIRSIKGDCSCSSAFLTDLPVTLKAGDSVEAKVEWRTKGMLGDITRKFVVTTDAKNPVYKAIPLTLRAEIYRDVRIFPEEIHFGAIAPDESPSRRLRVRATDSAIAKSIESVDSTTELVSAEITEVKENWIAVDVSVANEKSTGPFHGEIQLNFDHPQVKRVSVPITGNVQGDIKVLPETMYIRRERFGHQPTTQRFRLRSKSDERFEIVDWVVPSGFEISEHELSNDHLSHLFTVTISDLEEARASKSAFRITTTNAKQKEVVIATQDLNRD